MMNEHEQPVWAAGYSLTHGTEQKYEITFSFSG
jgi:hypothetical protein